MCMCVCVYTSTSMVFSGMWGSVRCSKPRQEKVVWVLRCHFPLAGWAWLSVKMHSRAQRILGLGQGGVLRTKV